MVERQAYLFLLNFVGASCQRLFMVSAFCFSTSLKAPCWQFPFLAMTIRNQAWYGSFGLTKTFFSRSSKSAFPRHGHTQASLVWLIWLNENVPKSQAF